MYNLNQYREKDEKVIDEFIREHPFAYLSGCDQQQKPVATQVPTFIEKQGKKSVLRGHIMKHTDHHKAFLANDNVLAVFSGKSTYVSATWYKNPNTASTWNYMSVQVTGRIRFLSDQELEDILRLTSLHFENNNSQSPTVFGNLPQQFKKQVMGMIVAFEVEIEKIDTVFKLSQDRDVESYHNIIKQLKSGDEDAQAIAREMEKRTKLFFP